ncbi:MAG: insulinase family protein, partial [Myxococcota bacterium]
MQEFWRNYYRPENATVVVVGDGDAEFLAERVARWFGAWRSDTKLQRPERSAEPPQSDPRFRAVSHPVKEARASVAWKIPAVADSDVPSLDMLGVILGHGESSRLYTQTQRRLGLVNSASAYAYTPKDPGLFVVSATMKSENAAPAVTAMLDEVRHVVRSRVTDGELEKARTMMLSDSAYQRETVQGLARKLGFFESVCGDFAFDETYMDRVRELTSEDLRVAAERYLTTSPTAVLLDESP